jgi:hypothetical protein
MLVRIYTFGFIKMIEMMVEDVWQIKPFLDEQEAQAWLASVENKPPMPLFAGHPSHLAAIMGGLRRNPNACM